MAGSSQLKAINRTGATILAGSAVYLKGYDSKSGLSLIAPASCNSASTMPAVGVLTVDAPSGDTEATIMVVGACGGYDTADTIENSGVWVGLNGAIAFTDPLLTNSSYLSQQLGTVTRSDDSPYGSIQLFPLEVKKATSHADLTNVTSDQHHKEKHAKTHAPKQSDPFIHAQQHSEKGGDAIAANSFNPDDIATVEIGGEFYIVFDANGNVYTIN